MQNSKSSTSSEDTHPIRPQYLKWAAQEDYKAMLDELLAIIHMDGGQYTLLTGYAVSLEDAATRVIAIRKEMTRLQNQLRK